MRVATRLRIVSSVTIAAIILLIALLAGVFVEFRNAKSNFRLAEEIHDNLFKMDSLRDQFFLYREDRVRQEWERFKEIADRLQGEAEGHFLEADARLVLGKMRRNTEERAAIFHRIVHNTEALTKGEGARHVYEELDKRLYSQLSLKAIAFRDMAVDLRDASARRVELTYQYLTIIVGTFAVLLALITVLTAMRLGEFIRKRLVPLHLGAKAVAGGDLDYRINCDGSDEFADLAVSVNTMTDKLQASTRQLEAKVLERTVALASERDTAQRYLDIAGVMLMALDRNGRITMINRKGAQILGKPESALLGADWFENFLPAAKRKDGRIDFDDWLSGDRPLPERFENRVINASGEELTMAWTNSLLRNESGVVVGTLSSAEDVTARRQEEESLRESEGRFRNFFEKNSSVMFLMDPESGEILAANQAAADYYGYSIKQLVGMPIGSINTLPSERLAEARQKAMREECNFYLFHHRLASGELRDVEVYSTPIDSAGRKVLHSIVHDITERIRAEAARVLLEAQLRESQKMQAIGTLAGGIAHDFNNILATILGNTALARQDMNSNPMALESLDEIHKAGTRARDLVQQILSFSRRQPTERKLTALAPIIEESTRLLRATLPASVTVEFCSEADVPLVMADMTQIEQIVINLATNAMQAMRGDPGRIAIHLDAVVLNDKFVGAHPELRAMHESRAGRTVRIQVSDSGPGMDAATLARIFEPFFTTKPVDEGTGLGLSVVHGIVQTHDGAIVVESQPGRGTSFAIYLPAAEADADAIHVNLNPVSLPEAQMPTRQTGQHILYLDDDESLVFLVQRLLERQGYRISGYSNQQEALSALRAAPDAFDLVVTDYNMPGMSGLDVARAVRAIRADLPLAIASGFIDETLHAQAEGAGVRELIFKANAVEELCEAFARLAQAVGHNLTGLDGGGRLAGSQLSR